MKLIVRGKSGAVGLVGTALWWIVSTGGPLGAAPPPQGRGRGQAPPTSREAALVDLTGYWVSVVTEDWRWRMLTPPKGDFTSVPLNAEGRRVGEAWDPSMEAGDGCKPYGVAAIMRVPGRLHITWRDDNTLTIETDAGQQTRLLHFGDGPAPADGRSWQGHSVADWDVVTGGGRRGGPRRGSLRVVTTNMRPGYLRTNGVPYSEDAVVTEYFDRHEAYGTEWFTVTTIVEDPTYLTQPFITSTHFKQEPDGSKMNHSRCE